MWVYYLLQFFMSICGAIASICAKQYERRAGAMRNFSAVFNLILALFATAFFGVISLVLSGSLNIPGDTFALAMLRGVAYVMGSLGYMEAIHRGSLLVTIVISQMGSLIPIVFSIFIYREIPTVWKVLGMVLLFVALVVFLKKSEKDAEKRKNERSFWFWVLMSFSGNGVCMLAAKVQQHRQPGLYRGEILFWSMLLVTVIFAGMLVLSRPKADKFTSAAKISITTGIGWAILYALCNSAVNFISITVVSKLPAIVFFMISTGFGILLSFLTARFLYREKLTAGQYIGCGLAVVGLFLLS